MRARLTLILLLTTLGVAAQLPPITVEWSAMRSYPTDYGPNAHISRDPVFGQYIWAVTGTDLPNDEEANLFLPDGTDVTPLFPSAFNVGSLDHLVDLSLRDSIAHTIMYHMTVGGNPQDSFWHLDGTPIQTDGDGYLGDRGTDLLVRGNEVFGCGSTDTSFLPAFTVARVVKENLMASILWNMTWSAPGAAYTEFSSVAVVGDSVLCAAFPYLVVFDRATGNLISAIDISNGNSGFSFAAQLLVYGQRVYFTGGARVGYYDLTTGQTVFVNANGGLSPRIAIDQFGYVWTTAGNTWSRWTSEMAPVDTGTLYESIDDMCLVNDRISFTGVFDSTTGMAYVITGTPQP